MTVSVIIPIGRRDFLASCCDSICSSIARCTADDVAWDVVEESVDWAESIAEELAALRSKFRYIRHVTLRYLMTPCETCRFCADRYRVDKWTNRIGDGHDWICQMDEGGQAK